MLSLVLHTFDVEVSVPVVLCFMKIFVELVTIFKYCICIFLPAIRWDDHHVMGSSFVSLAFSERQ